jgi:CHAT domain-containing protein/tetratricopeptide (TPR) repeat protein
MARVRTWRGMPFAGVCLTLALLAWSVGLEAQAADDLDALDAKISELQLAGKYADVLPLAERYVAESKARFGEASLEHAAALDRLAQTYFAQSSFDAAEPIYLRVLVIREKVLGQRHEDVLSTLGMLSNVYRSTRRPHLAEPLLKRILAEQEQAAEPDQASIAATLQGLAEVDADLKRYGEAEAHIRRALALFETPGANPTQVAELLGVLAQIERRQGSLEEAASTLQRAIALHEMAIQAKDAGILEQAAHIQALAQMAALALEMNHLDVADEMAERIAVLSEKMLGPDHPVVAGALEAVANSYERQGRLVEAEARRKRAIDIYERAYGKDHIDIALSLQRLGKLYAQQYRFDDAMQLMQRGLTIAESTLGPEHPALFDHLASLGELYVTVKNWGAAEPLMTRALSNLDKAQGLDPIDSGVQTIRILRDLGYLHALQGRQEDARRYLERALATSERVLGPDHEATAETLSALAAHALAQDHLDEAEKHFERALPLSEKADRNGRGHANNLAGLGMLHFKRQDWAKAHAAMQSATAIFIALEQRGDGGATAGVREDASRPVEYEEFFLSQAVAAYRLAAIDTEHADALGEEAFELAQRTQSSQAAAALSQMAARFASGTGALSALMRERQDLVGEWRAVDAHLTAALTTPPDQRDAVSQKALRARLAEVARRIDLLDGRLAKEFPEYAALTSPKPLSIEATQNVLAPNEVLIFVASLAKQSLVWVIGRDTAHLVLVPVGTDELARDVAALRCGLDEAAWEITGSLSCKSLLGISWKAPGPLPFDLSRAHALYSALLAPLKDMIEGKQLLIAAVGPLATLPFSVLVTERPAAPIPHAANRYAEAAWLSRGHAVTTLPSVASLSSLRLAAKPSLAAKPFIGFGNPLLSGRDDADRRAWDKESCPKDIAKEPLHVAGLPDGLAKLFRGNLADTQVLRRQDPLPETADELCAVAGELAAEERDVNLGSRATESAVKALNEKGALATYKTVHFATHGLLAGETESVGGGAEPSLLLTPPDAPTSADDGLLTASEIAQLKLDADWIVLSACNTAGGEKGGAEALSGLARAFFYAGARALLVSHWYVDSDAAVKLVTQAFAELRRHPAIGRAEAMRRAMLTVMNDTSRPARWTPAAHPSVWAPFVVVGEGGATR